MDRTNIDTAHEVVVRWKPAGLPPIWHRATRTRHGIVWQWAPDSHNRPTVWYPEIGDVTVGRYSLLDLINNAERP